MDGTVALEYPIELILWEDATSEDGWKEVANLESQVHVIQSVGFLVVENEKVVILALNIDPEGEAQSQNIRIPKKMILARRTLHNHYNQPIPVGEGLPAIQVPDGETTARVSLGTLENYPNKAVVHKVL